MISLSGCLLIDKKIGLTSRQEVNNISKLLHTKKCGHIGTLDPFASGLLIVLVGKATKISSILEAKDKTYIATLKLGVKTDSGDKDGKIIETKDIPTLNEKIINEALNSFLGESFQLPPMYSALKLNGKHYYDYARRGETIEREKRKINVFSIELISFDNDSITFKVKVSKGTYIRTLGEDIANKLNCVGHLISLRRTQIGNFDVINAIGSDKVELNNLISIEDMLKDFPTLIVDEKTSFKAKNGVALTIENQDSDLLLIKDFEGIIALYKKEHNNMYVCLRGLR